MNEMVFLGIYFVFTLIYIAVGSCLLYLSRKEKLKQVQYCEHCGEKILPKASYCAKCGNKVFSEYNDSKRLSLLIFGAYLLIQGTSCLLALIFQIIIRIIFF